MPFALQPSSFARSLAAAVVSAGLLAAASSAQAQATAPAVVTSVSPQPTRAVYNAIDGLATVSIRSSRPLTAAPGSIRIWDRGQELAPTAFTVTPTPNTPELVIRFDQMVKHARLTIVLTRAVTDATAIPLDGECADPYQPTLPSGDGSPGGELVLQYDVLAADFTRDRCVGMDDLSAFLEAFFTNDPAADVNRSNLVSVQDIFDFLAAYFAGCA